MPSPKTNLNFIRCLGIGLVALPEPVTTALGVALLVAAGYLSRQFDAGPDNLLLETPNAWFKRSGDHAAGGPGLPGEVRLYRHSLEADTFSGWPMANTRADVAHHVVDLPTLCRRYGLNSDGSKARPKAPLSSNKLNTVSHRLDLPALQRRYKIAPARRGGVTPK
ncbi:MAG: hypothetical protein PVJ61_06245 [Dehalococcoidia bacterium]|jgi:hypothetical protein